MHTIQKRSQFHKCSNRSIGISPNKNNLFIILAQNFRNVMKKFKTVIAYTTGFMSGIVLDLGIAALLNRNGMPGGEMLILPLMAGIFYLGFDMGRNQNYKEV